MSMAGDVKLPIKFPDGGWSDWGRNGVPLFFRLWGGRLTSTGLAPAQIPHHIV